MTETPGVDWAQVGLGGARMQCRFRTRGAARLAAQHLMWCHPHHFAVVGEGQTLLMSEMAVDCLKKKFEPAVQPIDVYEAGRSE